MQGVVPGKKSGNHPGLSPSKGQKPNPGAPTRPGDQLPSMSLVQILTPYTFSVEGQKVSSVIT
jgi:hypothetical protein